MSNNLLQKVFRSAKAKAAVFGHVVCEPYHLMLVMYEQGYEPAYTMLEDAGCCYSDIKKIIGSFCPIKEPIHVEDVRYSQAILDLWHNSLNVFGHPNAEMVTACVFENMKKDSQTMKFVQVLLMGKKCQNQVTIEVVC